jgi:hypothetical protein
MASDDPERIWLEPGDGAPDTGRLWCRDDVWTGDGAYEGELPTEYVRADLCERDADGDRWRSRAMASRASELEYRDRLAAAEARVAELEAALRVLIGALQDDGEHGYTTLDQCPVCDGMRAARSALGP